MEKLSNLLPSIILDPRWKREGHLSIGNKILYKRGLSIGAKVMYWYFLSRCFQKDNCFPGNKTIGEDLGIKRPETIIKYKSELVKHGLIKVIRRGKNKTNIYIIKIK